MHERDILEDHLRLAELRVVEAEEIVAKQLNLVHALVSDGHETTDARKLLAEFEGILKLHIADRDRLRAELETLE